MCVNLTIINDEILEGDHSFSVSLSSNDPVTIDVPQVSVIILDDDCK